MHLRYHGYDVAGVSFGGMFGQKAVGGWSLKLSLTFSPKQIPQGPQVTTRSRKSETSGFMSASRPHQCR